MSKPKPKAKPIRSFKHLLGKLHGISDAQLEAHFGLYEGYVKKINEIEEKLPDTDNSKSNYSYNEYSELKRRYAVPYMGAYLHELYFDNLLGTSEPSAKFKELAEASYGSYENWKADAKATGLEAPGWVLTCYDTVLGRLNNILIMEHHIGFTLNHYPILILDTWEHAFFLDFKADRGAYIETFFKNVNWDVVNKRLDLVLKFDSLKEDLHESK